VGRKFRGQSRDYQALGVFAVYTGRQRGRKAPREKTIKGCMCCRGKAGEKFNVPSRLPKREFNMVYDSGGKKKNINVKVMT